MDLIGQHRKAGKNLKKAIEENGTETIGVTLVLSVPAEMLNKMEERRTWQNVNTVEEKRKNKTNKKRIKEGNMQGLGEMVDGAR